MADKKKSRKKCNDTQRSRKQSKTVQSRKKQTRKVSDSSNGLMTKVWGPAGWIFLHSCAAGYPATIKSSDDRRRKKKTKLFFETIGHIFPCKYCRDSYIKFIKELPIDKFLGSRKSLTRWLYRIHNKVNKKLGVPPCDIPSYNDVSDQYESYRAKCKPTTNKARLERIEKGCVVPKDGRKKRCVIKIINTK